MISKCEVESLDNRVIFGSLRISLENYASNWKSDVILMKAFDKFYNYLFRTKFLLNVPVFLKNELQRMLEIAFLIRDIMFEYCVMVLLLQGEVMQFYRHRSRISCIFFSFEGVQVHGVTGSLLHRRAYAT